MNQARLKAAWSDIEASRGMHIFAKRTPGGVTIETESASVAADMRIKHNDPHYVGFFTRHIGYKEFCSEVESSIKIIRGEL